MATHGLQSCERLRLALESFEPEKDQECFVRGYGTGNAMPDPPHFVNYSSAEGALTSSASKVTSRPAQFTRVTQRINRLSTAAPPQQQPQHEDEPVVNTAGVGSGNRPPNPNDAMLARGGNLSRSSTRRQAPPTNGSSTTNGPINGVSPSSSPPVNARRSTSNAPSAPSAQHEFVGENSPRVDPSKDQQGVSRPANSSKVGDETDPMVQAMTNLRIGTGASVGRSATRRVPAPDAPGSGLAPVSPTKALLPPAPVSPSRDVDYRNSAEIVVGAPPTAQTPHSRSTSPVPPTANFMQPPPSQAPAPVVDAVIDSYHQSFPGERRSRSNSRRASFNAPQPTAAPLQASQGNHLERPLSREGHVGIGANGRSRSPSISNPASPGTSPVPTGLARVGGGNHLDQGAGQGQYRATTPNSVGIALDPHGNVAMDSMADVYRHQQQAQARQVQQAQVPPPMQAPPPAPVQNQQPQAQLQRLQTSGSVLATRSTQRQTGINNSYVAPTSWQSQPSATSPQQYVVSPAATQQAPHHTPAYMQPPHPYANAPPSQMYHSAQLNYGMQQPPQQPSSQQQQQQQQRQQQQQPVQHGATGSGSGDYYPPPQHQGYAQPPPQQQQQQLQRPQQFQQVPYGGGGYRSLSPGPVNRSPSPQPMALTQPQPQPLSEPPTRQYTEDGRGVLFYGAFFVPRCDAKKTD
jgi:hypothetical protein